VKRIAFISAAAVAGAGAMLILATTASTTWSQSTTRPSNALAVATPTTQQRAGDPDPRATYRGRFDGRSGGGSSSSGGGGGDGMRARMEWRRNGGGFGGFGEPRPENFAEPTPEEWKDIEAFMKANSPERLARLDDIADDKRQQNVKNMFAARYRALQDLKEQDAEMYKIRVARMPVEDKVFELSWKLTHNRKEPKPDDLRNQLRGQLRLLVRSRLDERALRLRQLEKRLANERTKLKDDEGRVDELVESNLADIAADSLPRDLRPQLNPRRERPRDDNANDVNATPAPPADQ